MSGEGAALAFFGVFWIIGLISLVFVIWVIYDIIVNQKRMPPIEKLIWVLVVLFLGVIGAIVYYIVVKRSGKYEGSEETRESEVY
jgi:formate hydrogenlyase subunit 3/multisubunit Na+/H+ antiporter MnhD subunit